MGLIVYNQISLFLGSVIYVGTKFCRFLFDAPKIFTVTYLCTQYLYVWHTCVSMYVCMYIVFVYLDTCQAE